MFANTMFDGLWTVEFISTINRAGKGVLVLSNGRLLGGDNAYYYSGQYTIEGDTIRGNVNVTRYDPNGISVLGNLDRFSINFSGAINNYQFSAAASIPGFTQYQIKVMGMKKEDI